MLLKFQLMLTAVKFVGKFHGTVDEIQDNGFLWTTTDNESKFTSWEDAK